MNLVSRVVRRMTPTRACGAALLACAAGAQASCGSAFCTLLNDRFALGISEHVGWSADVRLESVTQDRLRSGTKTIAPSDVTGEDTIERHTRNLNLVTTLERAFDEHWSIALRVPVVKRDHLHDLLDADSGAVGPSEHWNFTRVGDVQALGRYQDMSTAQNLSWALLAGFKLPTGSTTVTNADGARAERALQPGSGTTDVVLGGSLRRVFRFTDAFNLQASVTQALNSLEDFKPGRRSELSAGWSHAMSPQWSSVLQLNLAHKGRDSGAQAEPENSGSTMLSLSPGVSVAVAGHDTLYGFVQLPLYQKVNGIQLVPRAALAVGWTHIF
jgi:hypothetical protein